MKCRRQIKEQSKMSAKHSNGNNNSASMKSIESSMIALSVSLSSYLTVNKPQDQLTDLPQQQQSNHQRKDNCIPQLDETLEPEVKAVVISRSSTRSSKAKETNSANHHHHQRSTSRQESARQSRRTSSEIPQELLISKRKDVICTDQSNSTFDKRKEQSSIEVPRNLIVKPEIEQRPLKQDEGKKKHKKKSKKSREHKHQRFLINSTIPSDISSISQIDDSNLNAHQIKRYNGPPQPVKQLQIVTPTISKPIHHSIKSSTHRESQATVMKTYQRNSLAVSAETIAAKKADKSMLMQKLEEMTQAISTYKIHKSNPVKNQQQSVPEKHQNKPSEVMLEKYLKFTEVSPQIQLSNIKKKCHTNNSSGRKASPCYSPTRDQEHHCTATFKQPTIKPKRSSCVHSNSSIDRQQVPPCQRHSSQRQRIPCSSSTRKERSSCCHDQHMDSHSNQECPLLISFQHLHACQSLDMRCTPPLPVQQQLQPVPQGSHTFSNILTLDDLAQRQMSLQSAGFFNPLHQQLLTPAKYGQIPRPTMLYINDSPTHQQQSQVQKTSISTQTIEPATKPNLSDYQGLVERYKQDNNDLRKQVKDLTTANQQVQSQLSELTNEKLAWSRVEQTLKERIHKLQQDYYQAKVKTPQKSQNELDDESVLELKLDSLQGALETLEERFEQKESELQCLSEICHSLEGQNRLINEQLGQAHEIIREQDQSIDGFKQEACYFKEKMDEMQLVIDQCSQQMLDFDQINRMSSQLIEQLQSEVDHYKSILPRASVQPQYTFQRMQNFDNTLTHSIERPHRMIEVETLHNSDAMALQQQTPPQHNSMMSYLKNIQGASLLQSPLTPSQGQGVNLRSEIENNTIKELNSYLEPTKTYTPERGVGVMSRMKNGSQYKQNLNNRTASTNSQQHPSGLATSESLPRFQHLQAEIATQPSSSHAPLNFQHILRHHHDQNGNQNQQNAPFTDLSNSQNLNLMMSRSESSKFHMMQHSTQSHRLKGMANHESENINVNSGFGHRQPVDVSIAKLEQDHEQKMGRYRSKNGGRNTNFNPAQQMSQVLNENNSMMIRGVDMSLILRR